MTADIQELVDSLTELAAQLRQKVRDHEPFSDGELAAMQALIVVMRRRGIVLEDPVRPVPHYRRGEPRRRP